MTRSEIMKNRWLDPAFRQKMALAIPSPEVRARMSTKTSLALKGRMPKNIAALNANKCGSGNPMWGKKQTPEHIEKRIYTSRGRKYPPERRAAMSEVRRGERGPNWKGGVTPEHKKIRKSLDFKRWREAVYKRDDYTCQKCLVRGGVLNPHHRENFTGYPDLRFVVGNGVTLCRDCHRWFHSAHGVAGTTDTMTTEFLVSHDTSDRPPVKPKRIGVKRTKVIKPPKPSRSESMRKRWADQEFRDKMLQTLVVARLNMKAHGHSPETRLKMSVSAKRAGTGKWSKGRTMPEEFKRKMSIAMTGKKNHRWVGTSCRSEHVWRMRTFGKADRCENKLCLYPKTNQRGEVTGSPAGFRWASLAGDKGRDRKNWTMLCNHCFAAFYKGKGKVAIEI